MEPPTRSRPRDVLMAARAEVQAVRSPVWRRPDSGPGSRSKSADRRVSLAPLHLTGISSAHATRGGSESTDGGAHSSDARNGSRRASSQEPAAHKRMSPPPVGGYARGAPDASWAICGTAPREELVAESRRPRLLRRRPWLHSRSRSPSTGSVRGSEPADVDLFPVGDNSESTGEEAINSGIGSARGGSCSSNGSSNGAPTSEESSSAGSDDSDADGAVQLETELADIEAQLAARTGILQDLVAKETTIRTRLDASTQGAKVLSKTMQNLEARIEETTEMAATIRRSPCSASTRRALQGESLDDLVGKWTSTMQFKFAESPDKDEMNQRKSTGTMPLKFAESSDNGDTHQRQSPSGIPWHTAVDSSHAFSETTGAITPMMTCNTPRRRELSGGPTPSGQPAGELSRSRARLAMGLG